MRWISVTGAIFGFCFIFAYLVTRLPVTNEAKALMPSAARASFAFPEPSSANSCSEKMFVNAEYWVPELVDFSAFENPLDYIQRFYFEPPENNLHSIHSIVVQPEKLLSDRFFDIEFHRGGTVYVARFGEGELLLLRAVEDEPRELTAKLEQYNSEKSVTFFITDELQSDHLIAAGKNTVIVPLRPDALSVLSNMRPLAPEVFALYNNHRPVFQFGKRSMQ